MVMVMANGTQHIVGFNLLNKIQICMMISLDQNKLFVSESLAPLTQLAKWYKEPTFQFSEL